MTCEVVGYEGGAHPGLPLLWGAAALRDETGVYNAVFRGPTAPRIAYDKWLTKYVGVDEKGIIGRLGGVCSKTEVPIDVTGLDGAFYVVDLRIDLLDRAPYAMDSWRAKFNGCMATKRGVTRGYFILESHKMLERWLYHLHAQAFELVPVLPECVHCKGKGYQISSTLVEPCNPCNGKGRG